MRVFSAQRLIVEGSPRVEGIQLGCSCPSRDETFIFFKKHRFLFPRKVFEWQDGKGLLELSE